MGTPVLIIGRCTAATSLGALFSSLSHLRVYFDNLPWNLRALWRELLVDRQKNVQYGENDAVSGENIRQSFTWSDHFSLV
jgi:hypothetical protein